MDKRILLPLVLLLALCLAACAGKKEDNENGDGTDRALELEYAEQFSVELYADGSRHIRIADGRDYICIPEGAAPEDKGFGDAVILQLPAKEIYLAASSAMDLFVKLDALDRIGSCSTTAEDYTIEEARAAIESGEIRYVGKYSAPDYETILDSGCNLCIESTMITHSPAIKEELERLGLPVLVERSSYEKHPLGRLEWIKLYGVLLGKEKEACDFFEAEKAKYLQVAERLGKENSAAGPSVAFFYVSANGYVNIRKPGDYISSLIETAGGVYCPGDAVVESDNALSTMNINWEKFYAEASGADVLIYNSTIDGGIKSLRDLLEKNALFEDFKAVKSGRVYCTNADVFQRSSAVSDILNDLYRIINQRDEEDLSYIFRLE